MSDDNTATADPTAQEDFSNKTEAVDATATLNSNSEQLDMLLDIGVTLTVEMGSKTMKLKDLLKLTKNSVIELDKAAGDPLDIKANGSLVAHGEVVITDNRYGIRITEVVSKKERMKGL